MGMCRGLQWLLIQRGLPSSKAIPGQGMVKSCTSSPPMLVQVDRAREQSRLVIRWFILHNVPMRSQFLLMEQRFLVIAVLVNLAFLQVLPMFGLQSQQNRGLPL